MREFELCFEFYGKKMKTKVFAEDEDHAEYLVSKRINFLSVKEVDEDIDDAFNGEKMFNDAMNNQQFIGDKDQFQQLKDILKIK